MYGINHGGHGSPVVSQSLPYTDLKSDLNPARYHESLPVTESIR